MTRVYGALAALCGAAGLALLAVPGMRFSAFLLLCGAIFCAALALLTRLARTRRWALVARRVLLLLFCAGLLAFAALEARIVSGARGSAADADVACVIVLGAGIEGTEPSAILRARLEAALDYIADKPDIPVVVSGCQSPNEQISEAECMYRWLTARGVDERRVWKEEQASSTRTNFAYAAALLARRGVDPTAPFAYVTSDFHVYRAGLLARVPQAYGVAARLPRSLYFDALTVNYYVREAFALANEFLFRMDLDL